MNSAQNALTGNSIETAIAQINALKIDVQKEFIQVSMGTHRILIGQYADTLLAVAINCEGNPLIDTVETKCSSLTFGLDNVGEPVIITKSSGIPFLQSTKMVPLRNFKIEEVIDDIYVTIAVTLPSLGMVIDVFIIPVDDLESKFVFGLTAKSLDESKEGRIDVYFDVYFWPDITINNIVVL